MVLTTSDLNALANRVRIGEPAPGQRFADQNSRGRAGHVMSVKQASTTQRDPDHFEVARSHRVAKYRVAGFGIVTLEARPVNVRIAAQRQLAGESRSSDSGNLADCIERLLEKAMAGAVIVVTVSVRLYLHGKQ